MELSDVGGLGELQDLEAQLAELLAEDDVEHLAAAMDGGSTAEVLIWENLWAAPWSLIPGCGSRQVQEVKSYSTMTRSLQVMADRLMDLGTVLPVGGSQV